MSNWNLTNIKLELNKVELKLKSNVQLQQMTMIRMGFLVTTILLYCGDGPQGGVRRGGNGQQKDGRLRSRQFPKICRFV